MSDREEYFRKFPLITYRGTPCIDIMRRIDFNTASASFLSAFYPYDIKEGETVQNIAHDYYGDVDYDWLVYLANDIYDPYHQVAFDQNTFNENIILKYGSIVAAQEKVECYVTNGETDSSMLDTKGYNDLLRERKKYWSPQSGPLGVTGYVRNKERTYVSTNKIITLEFANTLDTAPFSTGENVKNTAADSPTTATVASCNTSAVILQHVEGDFDVSADFNLTGTTETVTMNHDTYILLKQNIPATEEIYFKKYSSYDLEFDLNEKQREISLLDESYVDDINDQLTRILE